MCTVPFHRPASRHLGLIGKWTVSIDGNVEATEPLRELLGLSVEGSLTTQDLIEAITPGSCHAFRDALETCAKQRSGTSVECQTTNALGVDLELEILLEWQGEELLGTAIDVTEFKQTKARLERQARQQGAIAQFGKQALVERELAKVLELASDIVCETLSTTHTGIVHYLRESNELHSLSGHGWPEGVIGYVIDATGTQSGYVLSQNEVVTFEDLKTETRFRGANVLHESGISSGISCVIRDRNELPWGVLNAFSKAARLFTQEDQDFMQSIANTLGAAIERNRMDEDRSQSLSVLNEVLDNISEGLMVCTPDGRVLHMNSAALGHFSGLTRERDLPTIRDWRGQVEYLKLDDSPVPPEEYPFTKLFRESRYDDYRFQCRRLSDDKVFLLSCSGSVVLDDEGKAQFGVIVARDIAEQERVESALRSGRLELERRVEERTLQLTEANREMEAFTYSVAHDLRAPLRAITSSSMILLQDFGPDLPTEAAEQLARQAAAAKRLGVLIDGLLLLSRFSRSVISRIEFNVSKMADEVAADILTRTWEYPVTFKIERGMMIDADPRLMRVVLTNLFENSAKFAVRDQGVHIEVFEAEVDGRPCLAVKDCGIGFDQQYVDKIFKPFERLVHESEFPGTGIGLANVKKIIDRHGGEVWAEGCEGIGATFFLRM